MKMNCLVSYAACFLLFFFVHSSLYAQAKKPVAAATAQKTNTVYTYKIIDAANGTYGYDVYAGGKLRIHQPTIPAMPGNEGFTTKAAAEKVAQLVIQKIKRGEMPPTISVDEMKKLKAV